MRLTKNFPSPKLADKKRDQVGFSIFWLEIGKKIPFWSKMSNLYQKGNFLTLWAHGIFPKPNFLDSPVNLGIVGEVISECTCPQTADQPANCSVDRIEQLRQIWLTDWPTDWLTVRSDLVGMGFGMVVLLLLQKQIFVNCLIFVFWKKNAEIEGGKRRAKKGIKSQTNNSLAREQREEEEKGECSGEKKLVVTHRQWERDLLMNTIVSDQIMTIKHKLWNNY